MSKKILTAVVILMGLTALLYILTAREDKREPIIITSNASYIEMPLDTLIAEADLIVIGNLDTIHPSRWNTLDGKLPDGITVQTITPDKVIFTDIDFNVNQIMKGQSDQNAVRIRSLGGVVEQDQMIVSGAASLEKDKPYLLFLGQDTNSAADIDSVHYFVLGGLQGLYQISNGKAISFRDEWQLEELIAYIQDSPLSASTVNILDTIEAKEVMQTVETAYDIEAEAAYSFNTEKFPSVFISDPRYEVNPDKLEFIKEFTYDPTLKTAGYLDYKIAYYNWWNDSTLRLEALREKAKAENREVTEDEMDSLIDSKWGSAPARAESPIREISLRFISVSMDGEIATVHLHDGFKVVILYLVRVDEKWYIAGAKET